MPALLPIWAAGGTIEAPDNTKINVGWLLGEKPPHEYMNWWQNLVTQKVNHILEQGVPEWDSTISYAVDAYVKRVGILYKALSANTNSQPPSSDWKRITEDAAALSTGVLPNGRLNGTYTGIVALTVTGAVTAGSFAGNGASITALNATQLTSGIVPNGRLNGTYTGIVALTVTGSVTAGSFSGNGASITSLNATQLATGTVSDARLPGTMSGKSFSSGISFGSDSVSSSGPQDVSRHIALYGSSYGFSVTSSTLNVVSNGVVDFILAGVRRARIDAGGFDGVGTGLSALNASQLTTGTVPNARISGTYNNFVNIEASSNITAGGIITGAIKHLNHSGYMLVGAYGSSYGSGYGRIWWSEQDQRFTLEGNVRVGGGSSFVGSGLGLTNVPSGSLVGTLPMDLFSTGASADAWVGVRFSDVPVSGIGSLAYAFDNVDRATGYGDNRPGSNLVPCNSSDDMGLGGSLGSGTTWRCLGHTVAGGNDDHRATLWQRVS